MPKVTFHHDGVPGDVLVVASGTSLMRAAVRHGVRGITGECGGRSSCATCHVYVHESYVDALPEMTDDEDDVLDRLVAGRDVRRSRLSCQVLVGGDIDEIAVDVPGGAR